MHNRDDNNGLDTVHDRFLSVLCKTWVSVNGSRITFIQKDLTEISDTNVIVKGVFIDGYRSNVYQTTSNVTYQEFKGSKDDKEEYSVVIDGKMSFSVNKNNNFPIFLMDHCHFSILTDNDNITRLRISGVMSIYNNNDDGFPTHHKNYIDTYLVAPIVISSNKVNISTLKRKPPKLYPKPPYK